MNFSSACFTSHLLITSESNAMMTCRSLSATSCQSASAVVPPMSFCPRQFHTPSSAMAHSPRLASASAFFCPSVIHSGTCGLPSHSRHGGGQSSRIRCPFGVSYLTTFCLNEPSGLRCSFTSHERG